MNSASQRALPAGRISARIRSASANASRLRPQKKFANDSRYAMVPASSRLVEASDRYRSKYGSRALAMTRWKSRKIWSAPVSITRMRRPRSYSITSADVESGLANPSRCSLAQAWSLASGWRASRSRKRFAAGSSRPSW